MAQTDFLNPDPQSNSLPGASQLTALFIVCLVCGYLIITSTVSLFPEIPVYDTKRIAQFVLLLVVFLTTLVNASLRYAFARQIARIPKSIAIGIVLFFALGIVSAITNSDSLRGLIYSLVDVGLLGLLLVLTMIIAACRDIAGQHFDRVAISLITFLGLAVGALEITGFWAAWSIGLSYNFDTALLFFNHPRTYNHLQTWTIPVLAAFPFVFPRNRWIAVLCIITLGLHWCILLVTGARGSVVSILVAFTIAGLLSPLARTAIFKWQSVGIMLGVLLYFAMFASLDSGKVPVSEHLKTPAVSEQETITREVTEPAPSSPAAPNTFYELSLGRPMMHTTGRSWLWKTAVKYALENPLLGIGPMNFACKGPVGRLGSPHNFAIQILSEWGIPAALVLAMISFSLLWVLIKYLKFPAGEGIPIETLRALLITAILAALVHLMVSNLLNSPASQIAGALIVGWLLGTVHGSPVSTKKQSAIGLLCVAALCSLLLLPFAYHETVNMTSYRQQFPNGEEQLPRLWQLGRACSPAVH